MGIHNVGAKMNLFTNREMDDMKELREQLLDVTAQLSRLIDDPTEENKDKAMPSFTKLCARFHGIYMVRMNNAVIEQLADHLGIEIEERIPAKEELQ